MVGLCLLTIQRGKAQEDCPSLATTTGSNGDTPSTLTAVNESQALLYTFSDDASWAIRSRTLSTMLGSDKQVLYDKYIRDCKEAAIARYKTTASCVTDEEYRLDMNRYQPSSVRNYTQMGYKKIRAPAELFQLIQTFYMENKGNDEVEWPGINTYHNMWEVPPTILHINQNKHKGGGISLQNKIWEMAKNILQEWTGQELSPVSLYGIRLYHNGSILAPHVDRFPLVTSAIINVDQDVDEDWPLEVYGHDGKATNVSMQPGDMVLYESHSVIHGRPFPLKGKFYANIFVHFEPIGSLDPKAKSLYDPALDLPPYLIPGSDWEPDWRARHPQGWRGRYLDAAGAARKGDVGALHRIAKVNPSSFASPDENGWTPFHEAVRSGNKEAIEAIFYSSGGQDLLNLVTYTGVTPLNIAREFLGHDHEVTKWFVKLRAVDKHPHQGYGQSAEL